MRGRLANDTPASRTMRDQLVGMRERCATIQATNARPQRDDTQAMRERCASDTRAMREPYANNAFNCLQNAKVVLCITTVYKFFSMRRCLSQLFQTFQCLDIFLHIFYNILSKLL